MPRSLRFLAALVVLATLCGVGALVVMERQKQTQAQAAAAQLGGGSVDAGKQAIARFGCGACHRIHGIDGADGQVGPSLNGIAIRAQVAGRLANRPDNLIRWIRHPQEVDPGNGMPDLPMTEQDARDMATYLYTLQSND
jgi:cytochrome c2